MKYILLIFYFLLTLQQRYAISGFTDNSFAVEKDYKDLDVRAEKTSFSGTTNVYLLNAANEQLRILKRNFTFLEGRKSISGTYMFFYTNSTAIAQGLFVVIENQSNGFVNLNIMGTKTSTTSPSNSFLSSLVNLIIFIVVIVICCSPFILGLLIFPVILIVMVIIAIVRCYKPKKNDLVVIQQNPTIQQQQPIIVTQNPIIQQPLYTQNPQYLQQNYPQNPEYIQQPVYNQNLEQNYPQNPEYVQQPVFNQQSNNIQQQYDPIYPNYNFETNPTV